MSTENIDHLLNKPTGIEEPSPLDETPTIPPEPPKVKAGYKDTQTAATTPMLDEVPVKPQATRELTDKDKERGYIPIFMGSSKEINDRSGALLNKWFNMRSMISLRKENEVSDSMVAAAKNDWEVFIETNYPDKTSAEMGEFADTLFSFMNQHLDGIKVRSKVMNEEGIVNQSARGGGFVTPDIVGKKPGLNTKGFSISEQMRRSAIRSEHGEFQFDIMLRNSYTLITIMRPNKLELANLVNDINRTVKGYVRTVGGNYVTLAYVAAAQVIWDFVAARIVGSSVTNIIDFKDLSRVVRLADIGVICVALIKATHDEGINADLRCLQDTCNWASFELIDPDSLVRIRRSIETPEDAAVFGNIFNGNVKYSIEETLAFIDQSKYGMDTNRVYNEDQTIYLEVGLPSLADAFVTFDYYVSRINPDLADIRSKVVDQKDYETQVGLLLTTLGSTEYIHWVKTFVRVAAPGKDEEDLVFKRSETDPAEFNKGLMDVLLDSKVFNRNFTSFILNKTPFMSYTFIGVRNYECPKCKANSGDVQHADRKLGYTPLDPLMAFFTLTQLLLMVHAAQAADATKEAISE